MATEVVPATDRGLAYGDGVFRTLVARDGVPQQWPRQYAKLAHDCGRVNIVCPDRLALEADIAAVAQGLTAAAVKIIVTRGSGERGYRTPTTAVPRRVVFASPLHGYPDRSADGIAVWECGIRLAAQPRLAGVKHLNRLENVLARAEWDDERYAEGLLQDAEGNVVCGTMTNLFIVERDTLLTPDLTRCGVAGVTRERVLDAAARRNVPYSVEPLPRERVLRADEVFLVNSLVGIWRVKSIGETTVRTGDMAGQVAAWLDEAETLD